MYALMLAGWLNLAPPVGTTHKTPPQQIIQIPPAQDELNIMFVASKGNRHYKILTLPAFQKELKKCILLHTEFFDTPDGPLIVFRCEESQ